MNKISPIFIISLSIFISVAFVKAENPSALIKAVRFNVKNIEVETKFFTEVLEFKLMDSNKNSAVLALGDERIELVKHDYNCKYLLPEETHSNDLWFQHIAIVVSDMEKAYQILRKNKVKHVSNLPQTIPDWNKNAAGIKAFYFKDPEGHNLELIYFPAGKGNFRWQGNQGQLFLGIDHTAIVVSDTEQSLKFYQELGFKIDGTGENYGEEQEHLNGIFGAHLKITRLNGKSGMGVEFLEYLSPATGRATPKGVCKDDIQVATTVVKYDNLKEEITDPDRHFIISEDKLLQ